MEYRALTGQQITLAVLHQFVANAGDAWTYALDELDRYFERVQSIAIHESDGRKADSNEVMQPHMNIAHQSLFEMSRLEPSELAQQMIGGFLSWAELLGRRVGELHIELAHLDPDPAFVAEPFTRLYQRGLYQSMRSRARSTMDLLRSQLPHLAEDVRGKAEQFLECEHSLTTSLGELTRGLIDARRIRCHGDLHLGEVLFTGKDFVIIDFEGKPERPVSERRIKASPLKDVASMLRSFHYAAHSVLRGPTSALLTQHSSVPLHLWADFWAAWVSAAFLRSYLLAASPGGFLPQDQAQIETLLRAYLLEKAIHELRYELNNRPDWLTIPLEAIGQYCGNTNETSAT